MDESLEATFQGLQDVAAGRVVDEEELDRASSLSAIEERWRKERRLALHRAAVRVLEEHPERVERALLAIERWVVAGFPNPALVEEWRGIIKDGRWGAMLEDSERGEHLRKGSPLCFVLDDEERLAIIRRFGHHQRIL